MSRDYVWLTIASLLYFAAARLGMSVLSLQPANITLLWLPAGIGLLICLRVGRRALPWITLSSFAANLEGMWTDGLPTALVHTLIAAVTDALTPMFAAFMLRRHLLNGLRTVRDLLPFCIYVCLLPSAISALVLSSNLVLGQYITLADMDHLVSELTVADSLGTLLIYPLYIVWQEGRTSRQDWQPLHLPLFAAIILTIFVAFWEVPAAIYVVMALFLYLAYQQHETSLLAILLVSVTVLLACAARNLGPFALPDKDDSYVALIVFTYTLALVPLSIMLYSRELQVATQARDDWMGRANTDALTGLDNRAGFMPRLVEEYQRVQRYHQPFVLAVLDIDHFKSVNDRYGHQVGDVVLKHIAEIISGCVRNVDFAARIGGEEFMVLFPATTIEQASVVLERIRANCEKNGVLAKGHYVVVTISIGAVAYSGGDESLEQLIENADLRLYKAKEKGRNRLVFRDKPKTPFV